MAKTSGGIFSKKSALVLLNIVVLLGLAGFGGYFYKKYTDVKSQSPERLQQAKTQDIIKEVGKLYALPNDEDPTIATVSDDKEKRDQLKKEYPFFDRAEGGDIALIYTKAKVAILYRPSTKQILKVSPVNVEDAVSIRTVGSDSERAAVEKILTDNNLSFTSGGQAKTTVAGVTVVDLKGDKSEQAANLAKIVKGKVGTLPAGEDKPTDVDLLILVGPAQ